MRATRSQPNPRLLVSPLRYPGGKGSLYPDLKDLVRRNGLSGGTYVEPYAGGAGAALGLLLTGEVQRIVINDLDPAIYAFWRAVLRDADRFADRVQTVELSVEEWARQRDVYAKGTLSDSFDLGFATFYLNRTNHSGVLNGGPIGGLKQTGTYKIDARFNRVKLLERLRVLKLYSSKITVLRWDGVKVVKRYADRPDTLLYVDPPYFEKAGSLYMNSFRPADHESLASVLKQLADTPWVLTYDDVPRVPELYSGLRIRRFSLNYSAHQAVRATELMVFSNALRLPRFDSVL